MSGQAGSLATDNAKPTSGRPFTAAAAQYATRTRPGGVCRALKSVSSVAATSLSDIVCGFDMAGR